MTKLERDHAFKQARRALTEAETGEDIHDIISALGRASYHIGLLAKQAEADAHPPRQ